MPIRTVCKLTAFGFKTDREAQRNGYSLAHKVKMRKLFNLHNDWLLKWEFLEGRRLVRSEYLIAF